MSQIDDLPPLREVIAAFDLQAKKSMGQNFLLDLNLTTKIAKVAGPLENVTVIEVGPGPGGLTRAILALGAKKVIAIEKDHRAMEPLKQIAMYYPGRITILNEDAVDFDYEQHLEGGTARIIANLPYNVGTPLLTDWLTKTAWPPWFDSLTLMFQKEVADRMVAPPGSKTYGRLSVLVQALCEATIAFDVPPQAFVPPPKVTSSVVYLKPKPDAGTVPRKALEQVTQAAFGQRRKMLRQSLKGVFANPTETLEKLGVSEQSRAEEIDVAKFIEMAHQLKN